jgi:DNA polymerase-3 subunit epsilon
MKISTHEITQEMVESSPTFKQIYPKQKNILENKIVRHRVPFDRIAIHRAYELAELELIETNWLAAVKIARQPID